MIHKRFQSSDAPAGGSSRKFPNRPCASRSASTLRRNSFSLPQLRCRNASRCREESLSASVKMAISRSESPFMESLIRHHHWSWSTNTTTRFPSRKAKWKRKGRKESLGCERRSPFSRRSSQPPEKPPRGFQRAYERLEVSVGHSEWNSRCSLCGQNQATRMCVLAKRQSKICHTET